MHAVNVHLHCNINRNVLATLTGTRKCAVTSELDYNSYWVIRLNCMQSQRVLQERVLDLE